MVNIKVEIDEDIAIKQRCISENYDLDKRLLAFRRKIKDLLNNMQIFDIINEVLFHIFDTFISMPLLVSLILLDKMEVPCADNYWSHDLGIVACNS